MIRLLKKYNHKKRLNQKLKQIEIDYPNKLTGMDIASFLMWKVYELHIENDFMVEQYNALNYEYLQNLVFIADAFYVGKTGQHITEDLKDSYYAHRGEGRNGPGVKSIALNDLSLFKEMECLNYLDYDSIYIRYGNSYSWKWQKDYKIDHPNKNFKILEKTPREDLMNEDMIMCIEIAVAYYAAGKKFTKTFITENRVYRQALKQNEYPEFIYIRYPLNEKVLHETFNVHYRQLQKEMDKEEINLSKLNNI